MKDNEVITQEALRREMPWLRKYVGNNTLVKVQSFGPELWVREPRYCVPMIEHAGSRVEMIYLLDEQGNQVALVGKVTTNKKSALAIDNRITVRQEIDKMSGPDRRKVRFILSKNWDVPNGFTWELEVTIHLLPPGGLEEAISSFEEKISTAQKDVCQTASC